MKFANNLKYFRNEKNMTQKELADKLGVYQKDVSRWEIGERTPSLEMFIRICNVLGISSNTLLKQSDCDNLVKEKIVYNNSCYDCNDKKWSKEYVEIKGNSDWQGEIEIQEKTNHFILAKANCRGSEFFIALSCYFDMGITMREWCVTVPNWDFGGKVSFIEKDFIFSLVGKYVENKVDCISLTNAIYILLEEERNNYSSAVNQLLKN